MYILLLLVIYSAFISLGLPDSLLGAAWPVMHTELSVDISYAGAVSSVIAVGTISSSLMSHRLTRRFGAGLLTGVSTLVTALAMVGFGLSDSFWQICLLALPFGLGAGAVDAALNNYVALHYSPRHMNWLHCFWGVGAILGPYIMGHFLTTDVGWQGGYNIVAVIQFGLAICLFVSLPLWRKSSATQESTPSPQGQNTVATSLADILTLPGIALTLITFLAYIGLESSMGVWASSFMVEHKRFDPAVAAELSALFFGGITLGRFISGFVAEKFSDKSLIRIGLMIIAVGLAFLALPSQNLYLVGGGLLIMGLGCAPIYPAIIHATPARFGAQNSQAVIGVQMAGAYTGSLLIPPLIGLLTGVLGMSSLTLLLGALLLCMIISSEKLNKTLI